MTRLFARAFAKAVGPIPTLCKACGGPRARSYRFIRIGDDPMLNCDDCERPVDENGRAIGSFKGPFFVQNVIRLTGEDDTD